MSSNVFCNYCPTNKKCEHDDFASGNDNKNINIIKKYNIIYYSNISSKL